MLIENHANVCNKDEEYPRGWPRLAAYLSSSDDVLMFRGFKKAHARILSRMQSEITEIENELESIDKEHDSDPPEANIVMDKDDNYPKIRQKEKELQDKLVVYGEVPAQRS